MPKKEAKSQKPGYDWAWELKRRITMSKKEVKSQHLGANWEWFAEKECMMPNNLKEKCQRRIMKKNMKRREGKT